MRWLVVLPTILLSAACGRADECEPGLVRCQDNVAETCWFRWDNELQGHTELGAEDCGDRHCQIPPSGASSHAFCALDPVADPEVPSALRGLEEASRCLNGTVVRWRFGYRVEEIRCGMGETCVDDSRGDFDPTCSAVAFCSPTQQADSACTPGIRTVCDTDQIVFCRCNYREEVHACASPGPSCLMMSPADGIPAQGVCR